LTRHSLFNKDFESPTATKAIIPSFTLRSPNLPLLSFTITRHPKSVHDLLARQLGATRVISRKSDQMAQDVVNEWI
jgi:hypothetical protein